MSGKAITVELEARTVLGKGLGKLRGEGKVPAVIHDHGNDSIHAMGDYVQLVKVYNAAGKHHPVEISIGGKQHLALIRQVDFEPVKNRVRHIVFQAIKQNETVTAEVPLRLDGEIPAERAGLMVLKQLDHLEIEALPKDLVDEVVIDATVLVEVGDSLTVADIKAPSGVTILTEGTHQIAIVEEPRVAEEAPEIVGEETSAADVPSDHGSDEAKTE